MSLIEEDDICDQLKLVCDKFNLKIKLKPFQIEFFMKALTGVSGFLRVKHGF